MKTIILGPPGTGKTTTLLNLVDEFIQQGVRPKQIGYFSFTRKAATEAATRAADKFGLDIENDLDNLIGKPCMIFIYNDAKVKIKFDCDDALFDYASAIEKCLGCLQIESSSYWEENKHIIRKGK